MDKDDIQKVHIPEQRRYWPIRMDTSQTQLAPPAHASQLFINVLPTRSPAEGTRWGMFFSPGFLLSPAVLDWLHWWSPIFTPPCPFRIGVLLIRAEYIPHNSWLTLANMTRWKRWCAILSLAPRGLRVSSSHLHLCRCHKAMPRLVCKRMRYSEENSHPTEAMLYQPTASQPQTCDQTQIRSAKLPSWFPASSWQRNAFHQMHQCPLH